MRAQFGPRSITSSHFLFSMVNRLVLPWSSFDSAENSRVDPLWSTPHESELCLWARFLCHLHFRLFLKMYILFMTRVSIKIATILHIMSVKNQLFSKNKTDIENLFCTLNATLRDVWGKLNCSRSRHFPTKWQRIEKFSIVIELWISNYPFESVWVVCRCGCRLDKKYDHE